MWLEQLKNIPYGTNLSKYDTTNYFKEYAEDFNTATLPHTKYYNYEQWEMEEYTKQRKEAIGKKGAINKEFRYREEKRLQAQEKKQQEMEMVKTAMSLERVQEMKEQARLKTEMMNAYRLGNDEKRRRLQKRLEPEEKKW